MKVEYINPFIDSARIVIEQMIQISPQQGTPRLQDIQPKEEHLWINIGLTGQFDGNVMYSLEIAVAKRLASAMMGGFPVEELDEMSKSAISELGNMISGNAGIILSNQGIGIDITPPLLITSISDIQVSGKALTVPLDLTGIGSLELQVLSKVLQQST